VAIAVVVTLMLGPGVGKFIDSGDDSFARNEALFKDSNFVVSINSNTCDE
jgi:hypothetical protein